MRFSKIFTALSLVAATSASALMSMPRNPLDQRDLLDICAGVDIDLDVLGIVFGALDLCICISALPLFIKTNLVAIAAVDVAGEPAVLAELEALINAAASKSGCTYPDHATPICEAGSTCPFSCGDGFVKSGDKCVCPAPMQICNGVCSPAGACPSGTSKRAAKRYEGSGSCSGLGVGWMACGVFGGSGRAFECVNTASDLESCGGCALPLSPYQSVGQDCTSIPGVADVQCLSGSCIVHRCAPGFVRSTDASACIPMYSASSSSHHDHHGHPLADTETEYVEVPAKLYGLEHGHYVA